MYEKYSRQALPSKEYRELLGSAVCVFNSNNSFVIENILRSDKESKYNWFNLIDQESGKLKRIVKETIVCESGNEIIADLFDEVVSMRNRIIHSFQITDVDNEQRLATKDRERKPIYYYKRIFNKIYKNK